MAKSNDDQKMVKSQSASVKTIHIIPKVNMTLPGGTHLIAGHPMDLLPDEMDHLKKVFPDLKLIIE